MGKGTLLGVVVAVLAVLAYLKLVRPLYEVPPLPKLEDTWWGPRDASREDTEIRPFKINVSNEILEDLQRRLSSALPFQESLEGVNQNYGISANLLKDIVHFWQTKYNWRHREKFLNQYPQFTVSVQGLKIHYLHVKPAQTKGLKVLPLLLLHGWPGSVREFYEMIPFLTTPEEGRDFVFEIIAPSLPGYGFSEAAVRPGLGSPQVAVVFKNFMKRLGYERYYIQGGDWGGIIVQTMATLYPDKILGVHSNMCFINTPLSNLKVFLGSFYPPLVVPKEHEDKVYPMSQKFMFLLLESGYMHLQATKPDTVLKDLQHRLENTLPFQEPLEGVKQHYGMNTNLLKTVVDYWRTNYNWRERETFLNQFPQFTVDIQGLNIHYLHVKPTNTQGKKVRPLLIVHGWPGSVREFYEIIPFLTTPQTERDVVFEVIAPSLPGFGFSEAAVRPGLGPIQTAVIFKNLMKRLGHNRFYVQGGDWGAGVATYMSTFFPENIIGGHTNLCFGGLGIKNNLKLLIGGLWPSLFMSKECVELTYPLSKRYQFLLLESGYYHLQASKPDTVGVALRESPVGLAAYILEKFTTWTNPEWKDLEDGGLTKKYTLTNLLDNVMIYWVTRSITTSMRYYSENVYKANRDLKADGFPVTVPSGCARFKHDIIYQPDFVLKSKFKNLIHVANYDGGHFAAFELPDILAGDIYDFVQKVEALDKYKRD
ncbi:hypothetical protein NQ317_012801 [Molorchus minor]|uniref:Epoxide hydrolase N-terminal domain-containing protein n=1 Tax=Molorchus minor TaxID=1323400 RepID=A0ABQ9K5K6_9CUCU|nr:hypothetical protein NQ317_012801 [Molorchus minor]